MKHSHLVDQSKTYHIYLKYLNINVFKNSLASDLTVPFNQSDPDLHGVSRGPIRCITFQDFNHIALRMAKTLWSIGCSECNRVKERQNL